MRTYSDGVILEVDEDLTLTVYREGDFRLPAIIRLSPVQARELRDYLNEVLNDE